MLNLLKVELLTQELETSCSLYIQKSPVQFVDKVKFVCQ
jgi:hypothetical protein